MINWDHLRKKLGLYLAIHRRQQGFSQLEVAWHVGHKNSQFISNIERGLASPPMFLLRELIALYDIKTEETIELLTQCFKNQLTNELNLPPPNL